MACLNNVLISLVIFVLTWSITGDETSSSLVIAPNCTSKCGNVTIPYPFGIEDGCYYLDTDNPGSYPMMKLTCDNSTNPPKTILGTNVEILDISLQDAEIRLVYYVSFDCFSEGLSTNNDLFSLNMVSFTVSSTKNKFVATGCDTYAWFTGLRYGEYYSTGCMTQCGELNDVVDNECNGIGCCEASVPDGVTNLTAEAYSFDSHISVPFNPCSAAYAVASDSFTFTQSNLTKESSYYEDRPWAPAVFNWGIGTKNCSQSKKAGDCLCKNNTICSDLKPDLDGYRCDCKDGFDGNPYHPRGCQDIDECAKKNDCEKPEFCRDNDGGYQCECPKGYHGNGTKTEPCKPDPDATPWLMPVIITASIGGVIIISLFILFCVHQRRGAQKLKKLRDSYFRQNGGVILHEKVSRMDVMKIFTSQELEIATDKYNESNIIGRGGYGVVYKGVLPDNQQVAIKRSLKVDPTQVEQFINEVLVLSQINNRHVVKLLGCCLETEVPLLVYEFINNGTLYEHLHDPSRASRLTWNLRLRIATEIAEVLSYLHTTISTPIIHRDMKSMNILLDKTYTAKVADFGASRLVPVDQTQLATMVLGTLGYLDPEYMQTSELTEKSDVYSFGIVLVELLTKEKALSYQRPEVERCLAMHFLLRMKEDRLFTIIDQNIAQHEEEITKVANLAKWCLMLKGDERPTMKEVAMELEGIKRTGSHYSMQNDESSFDQEHRVGISSYEGSNTNTSGMDSDLYSIPTFVPPRGYDGR